MGAIKKTLVDFRQTFTCDCRHLPATADIYLRLQTFTCDCRHLPATEGCLHLLI
jgi:hypothetical protein